MAHSPTEFKSLLAENEMLADSLKRERKVTKKLAAENSDLKTEIVKLKKPRRRGAAARVENT